METSSFCKRLKEERKRLGLNQVDAADLCSVQRETWSRYETGANSPGMEVLAAFASAGADVGYILTGQRLQTGGIREQGGTRRYDTNPRIQAIVKLLEEMSDEGLSHVRDAIEKEKQIAELKAELARLKTG